jgi:superfamily I DNA and RNA helicase
LSDDGIDFFHADSAALEENSQLIEKDANEAFQFKEEDYKRLIAALAFLSSVKKIEETRKKGLTVLEMKRATQEGEKGKEISKKFRTQSAVEAVPDSKYKEGNIVVWLDPIQREIMNNNKELKKLVIIGPASTGKTILIQLKVLELVKKPDEKALIILPYNQLEEKYKEFFCQNGEIDITGRVQFVTPDNKDWPQRLGENKDSHWFIDEFAALHAGHKDLCKKIIAMSK